MRRFTIFCLIAGTLAFGGTGITRATSLDDAKDAELKRKAEEVDRLRKQLDQQEAELKRLQQENKQLRQQKTPPATSGAAGQTAPKPVTPIATLPPLADGAVVEATELAGHFATEPDAAAQRYTGKRIKVRGEVLRFSRGMVTRDYSIVLATGDPAATVVCIFRYTDAFTGVYPKGHGGELVARFSGGSETTLARAGQLLTAFGKCKGYKDGAVVLTGCEMIQ